MDIKKLCEALTREELHYENTARNEFERGISCGLHVAQSLIALHSNPQFQDALQLRDRERQAAAPEGRDISKTCMYCKFGKYDEWTDRKYHCFNEKSEHYGELLRRSKSDEFGEDMKTFGCDHFCEREYYMPLEEAMLTFLRLNNSQYLPQQYYRLPNGENSHPLFIQEFDTNAQLADYTEARFRLTLAFVQHLRDKGYFKEAEDESNT